LDCGTIGYGFIWVDTSVWFFAVEEVLNELLDFGDSCGTTNQYYFINICFLHASVIKYLLYWLKSLLE
jgi:hypothetical protein